jgi:hypothetical protein
MLEPWRRLCDVRGGSITMPDNTRAFAGLLEGSVIMRHVHGYLPRSRGPSTPCLSWDLVRDMFNSLDPLKNIQLGQPLLPEHNPLMFLPGVIHCTHNFDLML